MGSDFLLISYFPLVMNVIIKDIQCLRPVYTLSADDTVLSVRRNPRGSGLVLKVQD